MNQVMKNLYIFATSYRPDAYINSIAYSIEHLGVGSIYVIVISEHDYPEEEQKAQLMASGVLANTVLQLQALKDNKYIIFREKSEENEYLDLKNTDGAGIYSKCLEIIEKSGSTGIAISLATLGITLKNYIKKGNCIFDVTALKKNLLVDVVTTLISYSFSDVYSFELKKRQTYDQKDLYHNLRHGESYIYRNLTVSEPVKSSMRRISKWALRSKAIMIFTAVVALLFIPVSLFWKNSPILTIFNTAAVIASISSYLFLLVKDRAT